MKKVAIGCLVLVAILALGAAAATYVVYRKVSTTLGEFSALSRVPELERSVRNRAPFVPPPSGELTASQVQRLLRVQQGVRTRLGARAADFEKNYQTLLAKEHATALDAPQILAAYRDLAIGYLDAKKAQVDALNAEAFSLEEYRWVRIEAYTALGVPMIDLDVARMIDDVGHGRPPEEPRRVIPLGPSGPRANQALVAPHRKVLEDNAPLAVFGL
jgi:hypothetical protein